MTVVRPETIMYLQEENRYGSDYIFLSFDTVDPDDGDKAVHAADLPPGVKPLHSIGLAAEQSTRGLLPSPARLVFSAII